MQRTMCGAVCNALKNVLVTIHQYTYHFFPSLTNAHLLSTCSVPGTILDTVTSRGWPPLWESEAGYQYTDFWWHFLRAPAVTTNRAALHWVSVRASGMALECIASTGAFWTQRSTQMPEAWADDTLFQDRCQNPLTMRLTLREKNACEKEKFVLLCFLLFSPSSQHLGKQTPPLQSV